MIVDSNWQYLLCVLLPNYISVKVVINLKYKIQYNTLRLLNMSLSMTGQRNIHNFEITAYKQEVISQELVKTVLYNTNIWIFST